MNLMKKQKWRLEKQKKLLKQTNLKNEEDLDSYFDRMLREAKEEHDTGV